MDDTLDDLPGEGDVETVTRKRVRICCDKCGEFAHYKHTFLLPNARGNPASKAYRKDDCSWCEDGCLFTCKTCKHPRELDSMTWCSTFPASARFAHLFLEWKKQKRTTTEPVTTPQEGGVRGLREALEAAIVEIKRHRQEYKENGNVYMTDVLLKIEKQARTALGQAEGE